MLVCVAVFWGCFDACCAVLWYVDLFNVALCCVVLCCCVQRCVVLTWFGFVCFGFVSCWRVLACFV